MIYTEVDLQREIQIERCKVMIQEYFREKLITIDYKALYEKLDPYPLLFQFTHLIAFHKMDWKSALLFCVERRGEIIQHELNTQRVKNEGPSTSKSDRKINGDDVAPGSEGQSL